MPTTLKNPVVREIPADDLPVIWKILGARRDMIITITRHGITLRPKGRHGGAHTATWDRIVDATGYRMDLEKDSK
jgi:hypothetical protein